MLRRCRQSSCECVPNSGGLSYEARINREAPCLACHVSAASCLFRPLPAAVAPLLRAQLDSVLERLCAAFPPARACLEAAADGSGSVQLQKMAAFRGRIEGLAAIRDEHDGDISTELAEGEAVWPIQSW